MRSKDFYQIVIEPELFLCSCPEHPCATLSPAVLAAVVCFVDLCAPCAAKAPAQNESICIECHPGSPCCLQIKLAGRDLYTPWSSETVKADAICTRLHPSYHISSCHAWCPDGAGCEIPSVRKLSGQRMACSSPYRLYRAMQETKASLQLLHDCLQHDNCS